MEKSDGEFLGAIFLSFWLSFSLAVRFFFFFKSQSRRMTLLGFFFLFPVPADVART